MQQNETESLLQEEVYSTSVKIKATVKKILSLTFQFVKIHRKFFITFSSIAIAAIIIFLAIPVITLGDSKIVNLNAEVRIEKDQIITLKLSNISVTVANFTNEVCPIEGTCFGSGEKSVEYILENEGQKYATGSMTPASDSEYQIETISSDYLNYSIIKIIKK